MATNNFINEKKKALLAYKEKILEEIKCYEKSIDEFQTTHKNISVYDHNVDSSDSEDELLQAIDTDPPIIDLKLKQAMMKTCLQATQELTSLTVLQSEVNVMVEKPMFEGEPPVTEEGTWQEVTAECRIDLVPFTIHFFMHTPTRKFAPPSYRGLRVVPVKSAHELELAKSVLHAMKVPSDAIEVLKSYAAGYRSRRTTLSRLANKYANALFMEPHAEGGFVLKCADLLELSWRLQNKWSPVAPFHHRMKFDLEYMDESYIKIITQAHKQLLNPAIQTDERTLLLAKIIQTCLEARGPIDPESDLESKTTERDTDIEKRDSETEKRDSEVMAPPKSLPKKQKNKTSLPNPPQKRSINEEDKDNAVKRMRNSDMPSAGLRNNGDSNRKAEEVSEVAKKRKINEVLTKKQVANSKNIKETGNTENETDNKENENVKDTENKVTDTKKRKINDVEAKKKVASNKNDKQTGNTDNETSNNQKYTENKSTNSKYKNDKEILKSKTKNVKETEKIESINANTKPDNIKESSNQIKKPVNAKTKNVKETGDGDKNTKNKPKNVIRTANTDDKDKNTKIKNKVTKDAENNKTGKEAVVKDKINDINKETTTNIKTKAKIIKEPSKISNSEPIKGTNPQNSNPKNIEKKIPRKVASKENVDANVIVEKVSTKKVADTNNVVEKSTNVAKTKNTELIQKKSVDQIKLSTTKSKENNIGKINDQGLNKPTEKNIKTIDKLAINAVKNLKVKPIVNSNTVKKVIEKHATNKIKDKISPITNKASEKNEIALNVVSQRLDNKANKVITNKKAIKTPVKKMTLKIASHRTPLKVQNPQKSIKPGNIKTFSSGNTEKENGGKVSKIPQKKLSPILSEGSSKKNFLRISPRKFATKLKSSKSDSFKPVIMKSTNIPRLLKKPAPKTIQ